MRIVIVSLTVVTGIAALFLLAWLLDVWKDRRHTVRVISETPVFTSDGDGDCEGKQLTVAHAGEALQVRRIRYWKNCATIDVTLPNASKGHLVTGEGDFSVSPPLN